MKRFTFLLILPLLFGLGFSPLALSLCEEETETLEWETVLTSMGLRKRTEIPKTVFRAPALPRPIHSIPARGTFSFPANFRPGTATGLGFPLLV